MQRRFYILVGCFISLCLVFGGCAKGEGVRHWVHSRYVPEYKAKRQVRPTPTPQTDASGNPLFREVGCLPCDITWDGTKYYDTEFVDAAEIKGKLGTSSGSSTLDNRDVYEIKGMDPKREVAVPTLQKDVYQRVVAFTDEEREIRFEQYLAGELLICTDVKRKNDKESPDEDYMNTLREDCEKVKCGNKAVFKEIMARIQGNKLDEAATLAEALKASLPEVPY